MIKNEIQIGSLAAYTNGEHGDSTDQCIDGRACFDERKTRSYSEAIKFGDIGLIGADIFPDPDDAEQLIRKDDDADTN